MDVVLVNDTVAAIGIEDLFSGRMLPTLASAELYVPQLGQSFVMTEETALCSLEKALSKEADTVHITPTGADFGEQETLCPLYLRFADGRRALLFTAGDGADGCADGSLRRARCSARKAYSSASACRWTRQAIPITPTALPP